ncbi:centromere protein C-like [Ruditapes philippinarum]|uniref:centromere protein C-like n=1 Tax=Ruditapes philippinarum TaxID=129788 RepID=UPI00295B3690|nr:centromere protein C-like [Ruditapes philippinarum]
MSAGSLSIKPNAEKPEQLVTADFIVFFIDHGKVLVKIHNTTTLLESGDTFMVPIGNTYSISNLRNDTAKFFYTIHKQWENSDSGDNSDACDVNNGNGKSKRMSNGPDIC